MAHLAPQHLAFVFGILGNIVSFLVYLSPIPTFYRIFKKKSTEGFQSIPYSVALFSAMLMLYYAFLKTNAMILITINSIGCAIETIYLVLYLIFAPKDIRNKTTKLLMLFNVGVYGLILLATHLAVPDHSKRVAVVGWICAVFSVCVFAAPLAIMRQVIETKSVEYMPFSLSFCLTLCAVMWFFYGLLIRDYFVATPNVLGFTFGIVQMVLYIIYKGGKNKGVLPEFKQHDISNGDVELNSQKIDINEIIIEDDQILKENNITSISKAVANESIIA